MHREAPTQADERVLSLYGGGDQVVLRMRERTRFIAYVLDEAVRQTAAREEELQKLRSNILATNARPYNDGDPWRGPLVTQSPVDEVCLTLLHGDHPHIRVRLRFDAFDHVKLVWEAGPKGDQEPPLWTQDKKKAHYPIECPRRQAKGQRQEAQDLIAQVIKNLDRHHPAGVAYSRQFRYGTVNEVLTRNRKMFAERRAARARVREPEVIVRAVSKSSGA